MLPVLSITCIVAPELEHCDCEPLIASKERTSSSISERVERAEPSSTVLKVAKLAWSTYGGMAVMLRKRGTDFGRTCTRVTKSNKKRELIRRALTGAVLHRSKSRIVCEKL